MTRSLVIAAVLALVAVGWIVSGQFDSPDAGTDPAMDAAMAAPGMAEAEEPPTLSTVRTRHSVAETFENELILYGRTAADRSVNIRAQVDGQVVEVLVERGEAVAAGDRIVRLAINDREARVAQAEALLAQREVEFAASARLNQSGYRSSTELAAAQAALDAARADLELAQLQLDRTDITAPFDGQLNDRMVELGDYVEVGQDIGSLVDLDPIRVIGQVSERHLGRIALEATGMIRLLDGSEVEGVVSYVGSTTNDVTRTFPIELEIDNPDGALIAGVTAEIRIPIARLMAHRISPGILTLDDDGQIGVRAVGHADTVMFHPVDIVGGSSNAVWVSGLPDTVDLIVVGQDFVTAGQIVAPSPAAADEGENPVRSGAVIPARGS